MASNQIAAGAPAQIKSQSRRAGALIPLRVRSVLVSVCILVRSLYFMTKTIEPFTA